MIPARCGTSVYKTIDCRQHVWEISDCIVFKSELRNWLITAMFLTCIQAEAFASRKRMRNLLDSLDFTTLKWRSWDPWSLLLEPQTKKLLCWSQLSFKRESKSDVCYIAMVSNKWQGTNISMPFVMNGFSPKIWLFRREIEGASWSHPRRGGLPTSKKGGQDECDICVGRVQLQSIFAASSFVRPLL